MTSKLFASWWRCRERLHHSLRALVKRQKNPLGSLPKAPQKGERIVVVQHKAVVDARVHLLRSVRLVWRALYTVKGVSVRQRLSGDVKRCDEGITWARGWDTPDANALRTAVALT